MNKENLEYVGFWPRVGSTTLDSLAMWCITVPLTAIAYGEFVPPMADSRGFADFMINCMLPIFLSIFFLVKFAATPGKMLLGAKVVDADTGKPLTLAKAVLRYLGYFVSFVPLGLGFFWIAFDQRSQGWHDKLANSVVVRPAKPVTVNFED